MAFIRLVVTLAVFVAMPLQILLLPLAALMYYPLQTWLGHRAIRWIGGVLIGAAVLAWIEFAFSRDPFRWRVIWVPLIAFAIGGWLRTVESRTLSVQLGWDTGIDPFAIADRQTLGVLFAQRERR